MFAPPGFGGANDPLDNGETASGVSTKDRPKILGCALPLNYGPCHGSPIPKVPWFTRVRVFSHNNNKTMTVPLIDLGPSRPPVAHAPIDLTQTAYIALAGSKNNDLTVDFRIIGGAKYLK